MPRRRMGDGVRVRRAREPVAFVEEAAEPTREDLLIAIQQIAPELVDGDHDDERGAVCVLACDAPGSEDADGKCDASLVEADPHPCAPSLVSG